MKKINTQFLLRLDYLNKRGEAKLYLLASKNRKKRYLNLDIHIQPKYWHAEKIRVKAGCSNSEWHNKKLLAYQNRLNSIIVTATLKNESLSLDEFCRQFQLEPRSSILFFEFIENEIQKEIGVFSTETIRMYRAQTSKLKAFNSEISFEDINVSFLKRYEQYLITGRGNNKNTVSKAISWVKSVVNRAVELGIIESSSIHSYKVGVISGNRNALTQSELSRLERLFDMDDTNEKHRNVLRYFLFSCYTGLRYGDMVHLTFADLNSGVIKIAQEKTKELVSIPIIGKALKYLKTGAPYEKCFKVLSNQKTNSYLKEIMTIAGIKKEISYHCSRHTFATISIEAGIPIDIVSKLLGHNSLKTTEIYTKYSDALKIKEMDKLQNL